MKDSRSDSESIRGIALTTHHLLSLCRLNCKLSSLSTLFVLILSETASLSSFLSVNLSLPHSLCCHRSILESSSSLAGLEMSLKAELDIWASALQAYDEQDFQRSLALFSVREPLSPNISSHSIHSSASPIPPRSSLTWVSSMPPLESIRPQSSALSRLPTWINTLRSRQSQRVL